MSGTFSKSILKVGTYHSPDGVVVVTPARLKHWEREARRLQSAGYALPSHFDHSNEEELLEPIRMDVLKQRRNRSAEKTVGHLERFTVAPDGRSAEIVLHTLTPGATQSVATNSVYVSPVIFPSWKDGAGNHYEDCLTSFDLVDHPVDHSQSSFVPAVRMGLRVCPAIRLGLGKPFYLGAKPVAKNRGKAARKARFKQAFKAGLVRMGSDYDPAADDDQEEVAAPDAADDAAPTAEETPTPSDDPSPTDTMAVADAVAPDLLDSVLQLLGTFGVALPDDTTDANLIPHLRVALTALLNAEAQDKVDEETEAMDETGTDPNLPGPTPSGMPTPVSPTIAMMSLGERKAYDRAQVLERKLRDTHATGVKKSLEWLLQSGRCTPAEHDQFLRKLGTVRMSLGNDGAFKPTRVDSFIEDRSTLPEGVYWTDKQRTKPAQKLSLVEPPTQWHRTEKVSAAERNEAIRALGGKAP